METNSINNQFNYQQSQTEQLQSRTQADYVNTQLQAQGRNTSGVMGQNEFLKLLITELQYQDPLQPMDNRDFIAQMAQFSALEQATQMNRQIGQLLEHSSQSDLYNMLGKEVVYYSPVNYNQYSGVVEEILMAEDKTMLIVNGNPVSPEQILSIRMHMNNSASNSQQAVNNTNNNQVQQNIQEMNQWMNNQRAQNEYSQESLGVLQNETENASEALAAPQNVIHLNDEGGEEISSQPIIGEITESTKTTRLQNYRPLDEIAEFRTSED